MCSPLVIGSTSQLNSISDVRRGTILVHQTWVYIAPYSTTQTSCKIRVIGESWYLLTWMSVSSIYRHLIISVYSVLYFPRFNLIGTGNFISWPTVGQGTSYVSVLATAIRTLSLVKHGIPWIEIVYGTGYWYGNAWYMSLSWARTLSRWVCQVTSCCIFLWYNARFCFSWSLNMWIRNWESRNVTVMK